MGCIPPLEPPPCGCKDNLPQPCPPLVPGTYTNATVTVDMNGCVIRVESGKPFEYAPQVCCCDHTADNSGGGGQGLRGEKGKDGKNATIALAGVNMIPADQSASVRNLSGDNTNVLLEFNIPMSTVDKSDIPVLNGVDETVLGWLEFEKGLLMNVDTLALSTAVGNIQINGSEADKDTNQLSTVVENDPINPTVWTIKVNADVLYQKVRDDIAQVFIDNNNNGGTGGTTGGTNTATLGIMFANADYMSYMQAMRQAKPTYSKVDVVSSHNIWVAFKGLTGVNWQLYNDFLNAAPALE